MDQLAAIVDRTLEELTATNAVRDVTLRRSRELIRYCAHSIRASHRGEFEKAAELLETAQAAASVMTADLEQHPRLLNSGYTLDALKELTEAHLVYAWVTGADRFPEPDEMGVPQTAYLKGVGEAVAEMRRHVLNLIRQDRVYEAEPFLNLMDNAYSLLMTVDFPDAITGGLRRVSDMVRGVVERTRGDLTVAVRQEKLREALRDMEERTSQTA